MGEESNQTGPINYTLLFERVMWRYSLVAQAPAASLGNDSAAAKPGSKEPKNPYSPADRLRYHFEACQNDTARRRVIDEALGELRHAVYASDHSKRRGTVEWKQALANDPRGSRTVAELRDVDHRTVLKYRKELRDS
jgi:hypothetical protein